MSTPPEPLEPRDATAVRKAPPARRIAALASNLLASGVVLLAGLVFGREVIQWWRAPTGPPPVAAAGGAAVSSADSSLSALQFGDFPFVLHRQPLKGSRHQVLERLRSAAQEALERARPLAATSGPASAALLDRLAEEGPAERHAHGGIWQLATPLPLVVSASIPPELGQPPSPDEAGAGRRIISWGLALPVLGPEDEQEWVLFTYTAGRNPARSETEATSPLPPGAQRILSLRDESGGELIGFRGPGRHDHWQSFFDKFYGASEQTGRGVSTWWESATGWARRYDDGHGRRVEVQLMPLGEGELQGLIWTEAR